jgi:hypothetical protein
LNFTENGKINFSLGKLSVSDRVALCFYLDKVQKANQGVGQRVQKRGGSHKQTGGKIVK